MTDLRHIPIVAIALAGCLACGVAFAGHGDAMPGLHGGHMAGSMFPPGVVLSADQKAQIHEVFQQERAEMGAHHAALRTIHDKMQDALFADGALDKSLLADLAHQTEDIHAQDAQARLEAEERIRDILTPEQRSLARGNMQKIKMLHQQIAELLRPSAQDASGHPAR